MKIPIILKIEGMGCQNCVTVIEKALESVAPEAHIEVSLAESRATVSETDVGREAMTAAIVNAGYDVIP